MEDDHQRKKDVERDEVGNKRLPSSQSAAAPRHTAAKPNLLQRNGKKSQNLSAVSRYLLEKP
jgi:hypothetical protein